MRTKQKKLYPFSRDALFLSIYEACKHRPRAIIEAGALVETIMSLALKALPDGFVDRDTLAQITYEVLGRFDSVAANVYAAYHPLEATK
ncbi:MAG TPA: hypothetical protein VJR27_04400 [Candidatus Saccharimonadales bacterium]|nr:hypothetical protein [Candidatus Saccharimonadales bacterium]